jgi:uncharacterized protein
VTSNATSKDLPGRPVRRAAGGRWLRKSLLLAAIVPVAIFGTSRILARHLMETLALTTGPNGPQTPASGGVPFDRAAIPSGGRKLDAYLVSAPPNCPDSPVVVIYHGVQETISDWVPAQQFLYDHCVSSVVFDYTGSGNSPRPARFEFVGEDSVAAYEFTRARFLGKRIYVLGHSMGNGPMLEAVSQFSSPPAGVIAANAFASLRSYQGVRKNLFYRLLSYAIPDWWNNLKSAATLHAPLLVIHSDTDQVNPVEAAREIFAAAPQPKALVILHGYKHNALQHPSEEWWSAVLGFISAPHPNSSSR